MTHDPFAPAHEIARRVRTGETTAEAIALVTLARIAAIDPALNAFTAVTTERALAEARAVDTARARGATLGPLSGVPFAVKNLFDVAGLPTRAGSLINRDRAPATRDAVLIERLRKAGAVLVGALNMGEYAYDFTGENAHDGPCRNPHDTAHMAGGSSSGCGAATAAGLAPISLGSDTNGSIRVPSAFCGIFGLKPTYGRLSRAGTFPFCDSLDHLGPFARSTADLAIAYDAMQGFDPEDHALVARPVEPTLALLDSGIDDLRVAVGDGYFSTDGLPEAAAAVDAVATALGATRRIAIDDAAASRAAAYLITNAESAALHLGRLRARADDFDPATRDRFLAGTMLPASWLVQAQRVRRWFHDRMMALFQTVDILVLPSVPCPAPRVGQTMMKLRGVDTIVRPNLGIFTQPISCVGLPVAAVPVPSADGGLPMGVQIVAAPWREDLCLRVAAHLERLGVARAPVPATSAAGEPVAAG